MDTLIFVLRHLLLFLVLSAIMVAIIVFQSFTSHLLKLREFNWKKDRLWILIIAIGFSAFGTFTAVMGGWLTLW